VLKFEFELDFNNKIIPYAIRATTTVLMVNLIHDDFFENYFVFFGLSNQ